MKNTQQKARDLFIQADLSKTEIAEKLQVSRRTIYQWSVDGDWEKLKTSARHMPAILTEKCYYLIGHLMDHILSRESFYGSISKEEVNMIYKLTVTMGKLRQGSTLNENMQTFTCFLENIKSSNPELADQILPHVSDYLEVRHNKSEADFRLHGFDKDGHLPYSDKMIREEAEDDNDARALRQEAEGILANPESHHRPAAQPGHTYRPDAAATPAQAAPPSRPVSATAGLLTPGNDLMTEHLSRIFGKSLLHTETQAPLPPNHNTGNYKARRIAKAA